MKRRVPIIITFVVGTLFILSFFLPALEELGEDSSLFFDIIAVFAFFLGGGNLLRIHLTKVYRRKKDWGFSIVTLAGFLIMLWAGLFKIGNPGGITGSVTAPGSLFQTIFEVAITPLQSTMYALLAFYVASASYRAFRAKNREATILLVAAFVILLGRTPFGMMLTSWVPPDFSIAQIPNLAIWIMNGPNLAGQRAIIIGIGLGVVSMSLRLILGLERTYLGSDNE
jgi:peptidoglycan/LPS O-acetylase OafA/YrhL